MHKYLLTLVLAGYALIVGLFVVDLVQALFTAVQLPR